MSLAIQMNDVSEVLLSDGWHKVKMESFIIDHYEFMDGDADVHSSGDNGICENGFSFSEASPDGVTFVTVCGPLTSILAIKEIKSSI